MPWQHCWMNKKEPNQCSASWSIGEVTIIESKPACCVSYLDTGFRKTLGSQQFGKFSDALTRYFLLCTLVVSIHISLFRLRRERVEKREERTDKQPEWKFHWYLRCLPEQKWENLGGGDEDVFSGLFVTGVQPKISTLRWHNTRLVANIASEYTPQGKSCAIIQFLFEFLLVRSYFPETPSLVEGKREIMMEK